MSKSGRQTLKSTVDRVLGGVLVVLMGGSVVNVLWQVFTRFVLASPSGFTEELARYLLIWIGILGAGYAVGQKSHLALELLPERLEGRRAVLLEVFVQACILLFALAVMVVGGTRLVYIQLMLGQTSPALGLPLGLVYTAVPISGLVMAFYSALHLAAQRRHLRQGDGAPRGGAPAGETDPRRAAGVDETEVVGDDAESSGKASGSDRKALPID